LALSLAACVFVLGTVGSRTGHAASFDLDFFKPAPTSTGYLSEESARIMPSRAVDLGITFGYARQPLVLRNQLTGSEDGDIVRDRFTGYVIAAFGIANRFDVGARLPVVIAQAGDVDVDLSDRGGTLGHPYAPAFGDVDVLARVRLAGDAGNRGFRLALTAPFGIPTGVRAALASSGKISVRPRLIAGWDSETLSAALSAGYEWRPPTEIPLSNLVVGHALVAGAGIAYAMVPRLMWFLAEASVSLGLSQSETGSGPIPAQIMVGLRALLPGDVIVRVGEGTGIGYAAGSARFHALVTLAYVWGRPE
jgi:hypothetical protein